MKELKYSVEYLKELISLHIKEPNRSICLRCVEDNKDRFEKAKGSAAKHQAWPGGYLDHVIETIEIAQSLYLSLELKRSLPFKFSDVVLTLFLHDLEKPWKHVENGVKFNKSEAKTFRINKIKEYNLQLTDEHWNALEYVEGEHDYHPTKRKQGPLAAFIHCCDVISARIWFDEPKNI